MLPKAMQELIDALGVLPGVGPRSAERFAWALFKKPERELIKLERTIRDLHSKIKLCPKTFSLIAENEQYSKFYEDSNRDKRKVCVVEQPFEIYSIEKTGKYQGTYHVLGGAISPIDGVGIESLRINELLNRINEDQVEEVILATNANVEGESTALLIEKMINEKYPKLKVTRLARGLPTGVDLEYADLITLGFALEGRK